MCLQSDLKNIELKQYKLIVLANAYCMSPEELEAIKANTDAKIMFNYASGICNGTTTDLENCRLLTGFKYSASKGEPAKLTATGENDRYFINSEATAEISYYRNACVESGCHIYSPEGTFVYTDNRILGIFSDAPDVIEIKPKNASTLRNIITGEVFENVEKISVELKDSFAIFELL